MDLLHFLVKVQKGDNAWMLVICGSGEWQQKKLVGCMANKVFGKQPKKLGGEDVAKTIVGSNNFCGQ